MPNEKHCVGCPYRQSNGWCKLTACANPKLESFMDYVVRVTYGKEKEKETEAINTAASWKQ